MNIAGTLRSLMYHMIDGSGLTTAEIASVYRHVNRATTRVAMGQSIDIGWHEGWYTDAVGFPYETMVAGKTGALFGAAAAIGTELGGGQPELIREAHGIGVELGVAYQMLDDYLDVYGDAKTRGKQQYEDLREGKISWPIHVLLQLSRSRTSSAYIDRVLAGLKAARSNPAELADLVAILDANHVAMEMRSEAARRLAALRSRLERLSEACPARDDLFGYIDFVGNGYGATSGGSGRA